jgi:hypothetical protein
MKCATLLNQSTTTMMASKPLDGGKLTMKSMDTLSHYLLKIDKGCNNPACFLLSVFLLVNQASLHILLCIVFQVGPIIRFLEERCSALYTTMARKQPIVTFLQDDIPHFPLWDIKSILFIPQ